MLTQEQIVKCVEDSKSFFGFDAEVYCRYLDYEHAKPLLKPEVTEDSWRKDFEDASEPYPPVDEGVVIEHMKHYMGFAIGKASDHRGLSANRSVEKMQAWANILGFADEIDWEEYANYGAPILKAICDRMGWEELYKHEPGFLNMAAGKPCEPSCIEGCGMSWDM